MNTKINLLSTWSVRLLALLSIVTLAACGGASEGGTVLDRSNNESAALSLDISASEITEGGSVTLTWNSRQASSCIATGDWSGGKASNGREVITNITGDSQFMISCSSPEGAISDSASVRVVDQPQSPALQFQGSASEVMEGDAVVLSWNATNADTCSASGDWFGEQGTNGDVTIDNLRQSSLFILDCRGNGGSVRQTVTVNVQPLVPNMPTLNFSASATSVAYDGSVTLSWSSNDADGCVASGDWSGNKSVSGRQTLSGLTADSSFMLDCTGVGGTVQKTVTVAVQPPMTNAPTLSFSASATSVAYNGSVTLSWNSNDADSCVAGGDWSGNKPTSGSQTVSGLIADSSFTLECTGAGGTASRQVNVTVAPQQSNGTATLSWTPPTENTDNSPLQDLAGFKIYYGTASGNYSETIEVNPGVTEYVVENLSSGTWYFVVTAYNSLGIESAPSEEVSKTFN